MQTTSRAAALFMVLVAPVWPQATYTAASCNWNDVNAVINGPTHIAVDGDTIRIPAGTCRWTSGLVITKGISILGAGSQATVIQDGYSATLLTVNLTSATQTFRMSSLALPPTTGASAGQPALANITGTCNSRTCSHIRLDHLDITGWISGTTFNGFLFYVDNVFGVLDHSTIAFTGGIFIGISHSSYGGVGEFGDSSWAHPDSYGSDNAFYLEDNTVSSNQNAFTDTARSGGGRFVVRFNDLTNTSIQTHGTETSGRIRSGRQYEVYNNTLTITAGAQGDLAAFRGGTGVVFNNLISRTGQFNAAVALNNYRDNNGFNPWGYCAGEGVYDKNDRVVYASGTVTSASLSGTNMSITDTSKSWTQNLWVAYPPYSIVNTSRTDAYGYHPGAQITSSTSSGVNSSNYGVVRQAVAFAAGDTYQILRASACIDQPGRGGAGAALLSGFTPSPIGSVNQPLAPIYEWGNTIADGGAPTRGWVHNGWTQRLAANRDYYHQASPFAGTEGTGLGALAGRPAVCTKGVAYWATDGGQWNQTGTGGHGQLYVCTAANTWSLYYTPYTYPHPLTKPVTTPPDVTPIAPPSDLKALTR